MKFLHAGLAVENLDKAIALWQEMGFEVTKRFQKPDPKAEVAMIADAGGETLELWEFLDKDSRPAGYVGKHVAFLCDDVRAEAAKFTKAGFKEVIPFTEGVLLDYIFVQDQFGMCYELAQEKSN